MQIKQSLVKYGMGAFAALLITGCAGVNTFPLTAKAGDTVVLPIGWNAGLSRSVTSVSIKQSDNIVTDIPVNDAKIRAVINTYPDPVSRLVVGHATAQSLGYNATTHASNLMAKATAYDQEWEQSMLVMDLPTTLPAGATEITVKKSGSAVNAYPIKLDIVAGTGVPTLFKGKDGAADVTLSSEMLRTLERADNKLIKFSGSVLPYAIQLEITRTAGTGTPWLANPRGDVKNISWRDSGSKIKVLITPTQGQQMTYWTDFKFYVAGGVTGLAIDSASIKAYDINGNLVSGVAATIN